MPYGKHGAIIINLQRNIKNGQNNKGEKMSIGQGKKGSLVESVVQVLTGWGVAIITQLIVYPLMNIEVSISQNVWISMIFIAVGFVKQYYVRRLFELSVKIGD